MKKTLLLALLTSAIAIPALHAGDDIIPLRGGGYGVLRGGGNQYRPIPRAADPNSTSRYRTTYFKPTQHFYTKDKIVSYRYVEQTSYGSEIGGHYLGPRGAVFVEDKTDSQRASVRNYATTSRRPQPGVPMTSAKATTKRTAEMPTGTSSIVAAK